MSIDIGDAGSLGVSVEDITAFYNDNWAREICLGDPSFYKWQFVDNPSNRGVDECCVAVSGSEIIGVMGLNSRSFYLNGEEKRGAELTTWVVSESNRNKGSGPSMISYLKKKYQVMTGMGISQSALPVYLRTGFRYIKAIPRHVHVINWDAVESNIESTPLALKYTKSQFKKIDYIINKTDWDKVESIFYSFKENNNCFSRSPVDSVWRYDNHPSFIYSHFIVNDSCHVVVRIDKDVDGFVMAHCVDIMGDHKHYLASINAAIDFATAEGADAIDFYATNSRLNASLESCGLLSTLDHDFFRFPHLFHPVEIRNPATTSLILWTSDNMEDLIDVGRLHITKQDADFDRPTMHGKRK